MATNTEERLMKEFARVAGSGSKADMSAIADAPGSKAAPRASAGPASAAQTLTEAFSAASDAAGAAVSYRAPTGSSSSQSGSSGSNGLLDAAESIGKNVLSNLGIIPLIGSLFGLFDGSTSQPTFQKYEKPGSINFSGSIVGNSLVNSDYNALGLPRLGSAASHDALSGVPPATGPASGASGSSSSGSSPQISVNVQAMDAKSFMDYSGQIAQAVREAMLNLSSLNDVVTEL